LCELLLQAFPSTLGEVTLHLLSQAGVFVYSSRGKWVFPPSCGVFLPLPLLQAFPLLVAGRVPPLLPSPASLFIYSSRRDFPLPSVLRAPHPLCYMSLLLLLITQFLFFFPWVGVGLSRGLCLSGPGLSVEYCVLLISPCGPHLPKLSGRWHLVAAQGPSWFLHLMGSGDTLYRLEVWRGSKFCLFSVFFSVKYISSVSPRFHFRRYAFCFLPLAAILESLHCLCS
jgi:hypothetical protein